MATKTKEQEEHFVQRSPVIRPDGGDEAGWGASLCQVLRGFLIQKPVEIFVRVFKAVLVDAMVRNVVSGGS